MPPRRPGSTPRAKFRPVPLARQTAPVHAASPASPSTSESTSPSPRHRDISRSPRIAIHKHTITNVDLVLPFNIGDVVCGVRHRSCADPLNLFNSGSSRFDWTPADGGMDLIQPMAERQMAINRGSAASSVTQPRPIVSPDLPTAATMAPRGFLPRRGAFATGPSPSGLVSPPGFVRLVVRGWHPSSFAVAPLPLPPGFVPNTPSPANNWCMFGGLAAAQARAVAAAAAAAAADCSSSSSSSRGNRRLDAAAAAAAAVGDTGHWVDGP